MKIIHQGIKPSDVVYVGACYTCRSRAIFKRGEAKESGDQREGSYLWVVCPVCDGRIVSNFKEYVSPRDENSCIM